MINLKDRQFGRLKVIKSVGKSPRGNYLWECICNCGKTKIVMSSNLIKGNTKSCGCLFKEVHLKSHKTHGLTHSRFYNIYQMMLRRCNNPKENCYPRYGGRGIKVKWTSFEEFKNDMYKSYLKHVNKFGEKQTQIDRINNNSNYSRKNCKWSTLKEQAQNTRKNIYFTFDKKTFCLAEWSRIFNIPYARLYARIFKLNYPFEKAIIK